MSGAADWSAYIGRSQQSDVVISHDHLNGLAALLDYETCPWLAGSVPPTGHWCTLFPYTRQSELGHDGHEARGSFIPPISYPRRMWAGGRIQYYGVLPVATPLVRRSTLQAIVDKQGRSGAMTIVTVCHDYLQDDTLLIRDEQDIVYRDAANSPIPAPVIQPAISEHIPDGADWSRVVVPDTTMLFRYSAVTFNAHRIHYDLDYVREEGYPGILVHGPLTATLLIDLVQREMPDIRVTAFRYTARSPLFAGYPVRLSGRRETDGRIALQAEACDGTLAMTATLEIA